MEMGINREQFESPLTMNRRGHVVVVGGHGHPVCKVMLRVVGRCDDNDDESAIDAR